MTGSEAKKMLKLSGLSLTEIATRMGITPQLLCKYLAVQDIKTGVLEQMAKAIGKDITFFYPESENKQIIEIHKETKAMCKSLLRIGKSIEESLLFVGE